MHSITEHMVDEPSGRKQTLLSGSTGGYTTATSDYPYAILQGQSLTQLAERSFQNWQESMVENLMSLIENPTASGYSHSIYDPYLKRWRANIDEARRLYVSAFINSYMEHVTELVEKDKKAGITRTIPVSNPTGATVTVTNVEHKGDIHRYWLKLEDPTHLDEPYEFPDLPVLRVDFSDTIDSDVGTVASSGTIARASAGSDVVPSSQPIERYRFSYPAKSTTQSQSKTPQKKPRITWE